MREPADPYTFRIESTGWRVPVGWGFGGYVHSTIVLPASPEDQEDGPLACRLFDCRMFRLTQTAHLTLLQGGSIEAMAHRFVVPADLEEHTFPRALIIRRDEYRPYQRCMVNVRLVGLSRHPRPDEYKRLLQLSLT